MFLLFRHGAHYKEFAGKLMQALSLTEPAARRGI